MVPACEGRSGQDDHESVMSLYKLTITEDGEIIAQIPQKSSDLAVVISSANVLAKRLRGVATVAIEKVAA